MKEKKRVTVDNMAPWVEAAKLRFAALKQISQEVDGIKTQLRAVAEHLLPLGTPGSVEFTAPGGGLTVTLKDPDAEGNRISLDAETLRRAEEAGIILDQVTETKEEIILTGKWIEWFLGAIKVYVGKVLPAGWTHKKVIRLSAKGVQILKGSPDPNARALLQAGLMTSSVTQPREE